MARSDAPGDIRKTGKVPGGVKLPNGMFFADKDKSKLVSYLRQNPGFVWKNRLYLKSQVGEDTLGLAGYRIPSDGRTMQQYEYSGLPGTTGGRLLRTWTPNAKDAAHLAAGRGKAEGTKVIHVPASTGKPYVANPDPAKGATKKPPVKEAPLTDASKSGVYTAPSVPADKVTSRGGAATVPARGTNGTGGGTKNSLFSTALKTLLGLDPRAGYQPLDADSILASLGQSTATQTQLIRDQMAALNQEGAFDAGQIDRWFGQIGEGVDRARTRGQDMTAALGQALAGNNQGLIASIGGEAAPGAAAVGEVAANGQNTLAALGAADSQFLNDIGPLLQGEGASLKAQDLARLSAMRRDYTAQLAQIGADDSDKRATLALQIAQANNAGGQQQFQNAASTAETLAGLALSGQKLTLAQQQAIAALAQKQQAMDVGQYNKDRSYGLDVAKLIADSQNTATDNAQQDARALGSRLSAASSTVRGLGNAQALAQAFPHLPPGQNNLAPSQLVQQVLDIYRSNNLDLRDPRVSKAAAAAIGTLGYRVDPKWVRGWS